MHPILAGRLRILLYLVLWAGIGVLLSALLAAIGGRAFDEALLFTGPLILVYAFICLSAYWVCRSNPVGGVPPLRLAAALAGSAVPSALAWAIAGAAWAAVLRARPGLVSPDTGGTTDLAVLFLAGVILYSQSIVAHYLVLAFEASRAVERRLLESQVAAREAELKALRAQINPHFLFNSLNSINALVGSDPEGARRMTQTLGDFLRASLSLGARERVTLGEELALADRYLAIEQVRFGAKLAVLRAIEPDTDRCLVPPLILQPLVENAVKHGVAGRLEGGAVRIEARRRAGQLEIAVENPYDEDTPARGGQRLGLENVRRRLAAVHADGAGLEVERGGGRFRAVLRLPPIEGADRGE